jgi:hypothetical protein
MKRSTLTTIFVLAGIVVVLIVLTAVALAFAAKVIIIVLAVFAGILILRSSFPKRNRR